jgi:nitrite reductase (NO-forming)
MSYTTSFPQPPERKETAAFIIGVVALCTAIIGAGLGLVAATRNTAPGVLRDTTAQTVTSANITLGDLFVSPTTVNIPSGQRITLHVKNTGAISHDLRLDGQSGTKMLSPGASQTIVVGPFTQTAKLWCTVPGHRAAGMVLALVVGGASAGETSSGMSGMAGMSAAAASGASSGDATIDATKTPAPDWKPFDPTLAPAPHATEHKVTFHVVSKTVEVAPGVRQQLWTFNGQVPGPILRGHIGDVFTVTLVNNDTMEHSIDFHASRVAPNVDMRSIKPGESLVYQFKADYAGIWMYHCGTAPALQHIGNGMFGAVIIDPPTLAPVAHEYVMVQSELYLGPQDQPGDYAKMQAFEPDAVVFNEYYNQYKFRPIRVEPNQRIRVWVLDAGPSENSSFHIVGTIFDTVFKEGSYLLQPDARHGGSQALDLQPAQGGFVEFSFAEKGLYMMVTHKFANVGKGALGVFQAGDVAVTPMSH